MRDVMVVGGGVIGCSIAWKLARSGLKVTVLERGSVGCEASRAAAGMLSIQGGATTPDPFFNLCLRSRRLYRQFADELLEASGVDIEYRDEGTLFLELHGEEDEKHPNWAQWQLEAGLPIELLNASDVHKLEPAVTELASRAVFLPEEHQIENRRLMDALDVALRRAGVDVIEGTEVSAINIDRGKVTGVSAGSRCFETGVVVVAAGTWSGRLLSPVGLNVELTPARGQMIAVRGESLPITHVVHSRDCYLVPRRDGRVLIGATVEYVGLERGVTAGGIASLLAAGVEAVPSLREFELVDSWSGFRPDTVDHLPILGKSGIDNLILATGHFRNGILLAPITAELITDVIVGNSASEQLKSFGIDRFQPSLFQTSAVTISEPRSTASGDSR